MAFKVLYKRINSNYKVSIMKNYIFAILIVLSGVCIHYLLFSTYKEGLENKQEDEEAEEQQKWQGTVNWYTQQLTNLSNSAKRQLQLITTLENKNKTYQHILQCLQYREKLMNAVIEQDRAGRGGQSSNSKSKVSGVFSSVKV